jgi:DNA repair exonuclease SbcCD ATPase subunit
MKRIQSQTDLPLLIEYYKKEIWKWKQKESQWISDKNLLEGSKKTIDETATRLVEISRENEELKAELARAKEDHQYDNLVHQKELKELNKK